MPTRLREHALFCGLYLACAVAVLWPLVAARRLPLLDWPQHLAVVAVLRHAGDPAFGFGRFVVPSPHLTTYATFYHGAAALARWMSVDAACRVLLGAAVVSTPAAAAYLLRVFGRPPWPALLAFVVGFSWPFYMGFASYLLGVPLALLALGLFARVLQRATRAHLAALALATTLLFFTHALAWLLFGALALALALPALVARPRRLLRPALAVLPSSLAFAWWTATHFGGAAASGMGAGRAQFVGENTTASVFARAYNPWPLEKLRDARAYLNEGLRGAADAWLAAAWLAALGVMVAGGAALVARREGAAALRARARRAWRSPAARLFGALLVLYLALPMQFAGIWAIFPRVVPLAACVAGLLAPPLGVRAWPDALLAAPAALVAVLAGAANAQHFARFAGEAAALDAVLARLPRGSRVQGLIFDHGSRVVAGSPHLHAAAYAMVQRGGVAGFTFIHNLSVPVRFATRAPPPHAGEVSEWRPDLWRYDLYGPFYDYLLVRGEAAIEDRVRAPHGALAQVAAAGSFALWRNTRASPGDALFAFRENPRAARIAERDGDALRPCAPWSPPRSRCPSADWLWVGPTEAEFDGLRAPCLHAPPPPRGRLELRFGGLEADGNVLRGFLGVPDAHAADGAGVQLTVEVDGQRVGQFVRWARRGYQTFELRLPRAAGAWPQREVVFGMAGLGRSVRSACFAATLFREPD